MPYLDLFPTRGENHWHQNGGGDKLALATRNTQGKNSQP
jgi:hypothetical protein